jgi:hypothetical protein
MRPARFFLIAGAALICAQLGPAGLFLRAVQAQTVADSSTSGRFAAVPTANGVLRLDSQTGAVSLCTAVNGVPECRSGPDERAALEAEIARLSKENADLRSTLAGNSPSLSAHPPTGSKSNPPSDGEVDRALSIMEKFVQRMMRIIKDDPSGHPI